MKEFYIDSDGIRLHAKLEVPDTDNKCPLLIVVHGFTGNMEEEHIVALSRTAAGIGFAALRVEMYGHGQSDGEFRNHTLLKWIGNILDVYDYARSLDFVTDIYLTGHSQGGLLTVLAGGLLGKKLKAIIPLSPAVMIPEEAREGRMLGMDFDPDNVPDQLELFDHVLGGDYLATAQLIHVDEMIRKYDGPVLVVHGTGDEAVPFRYGRETAEAYKNGRLVAIKDANHGYEGHIDEMCEAVREFLLEYR